MKKIDLFPLIKALILLGFMTYAVSLSRFAYSKPAQQSDSNEEQIRKIELKLSSEKEKLKKNKKQTEKQENRTSKRGLKVYKVRNNCLCYKIVKNLKKRIERSRLSIVVYLQEICLRNFQYQIFLKLSLNV